MHRRRVGVVLGDGQMAAMCARLLAEHAGIELPVVIHHDAEHDWSSQLQKFSKTFRIPHVTVENVNDKGAWEILNDIHPDIVFSVNNWDVIHADLLTIPGDGVINFHNGPLPEYRGVNVPSWAIINGQKYHGVTWHRVSEKIDGGDIVASGTFELNPQETAISLTMRCITTGVELFSPLLDRYVSGRLDSWPQQGEAHYYSAKESPNQGYLDFNMSFDRLSALVRGLTFRPFDNIFVYPKIHAGQCRTLLVSEITFARKRGENETWTCGEIRKVDDQSIVVCAGDGLVRLSGLMEEGINQPTVVDTASRYELTVGKMLR